MGYDRLVDSAKHDAALTATANAIRAKSGNTAKISWNATTGFASAIAAIASGSRVATGSFLSNEYTYDKMPNGLVNANWAYWTISGLGFKPSTVIIYADPSNGIDTGCVLYVIRLGDFTRCVASRIDYYEEEDDEGESYSWEEYSINRQYYNHTTGEGSQFLTKIDTLDDGFKLTLNQPNIDLGWNKPYCYIAIG